MIANSDYPPIKSILGPVTACGHTWNVGDRVLVHGAFGRDILGTIIGFWKTAHPIHEHDLVAKASCDDFEVRVISLALQTCFLGLGNYAGDPNRPGIEWYEERARAASKSIASGNHSTPKSVTRARQSPAGPTRRESVTLPHRSQPTVTVVEQADKPLSDHPGYAPSGQIWHRCEACRAYFLSKRGHAKTCSAKCRKALSRKTGQM